MSKEIKNWEEGLSDIINRFSDDSYFELIDGYIPLEDFIRQTLQSQKDKLRETIRGMKKEYAKLFPACLCKNEKHECGYSNQEGYSEALNQVLSLIEKEI
uniref:Uncharacterized protein n=1 Tax=viral metagenome TaxID=1070528 RepID=A0A6M3XZ41_9ZZZZ